MLYYKEISLPLAYRWLVAHELVDFSPWEMIDEQSVADALAKQYALEVSAPNPSVTKEILPFMRRGDCDDLAGFVIEQDRISEAVLYVHLTWSQEPQVAPYPESKTYASLWSFLAEHVISDMQAWANEDELEDMDAL